VALNLLLLWGAFRKNTVKTALPRAIALGLGMCMLFGWERGNLVIPCFTFFVLAYGNFFKRGWLSILFAAVAINFKPYLLLSASGRLLRRDWRWVEYLGVWTLVVYITSYIVWRDGDPAQIIANTVGFGGAVTAAGYGLLEYTTTYTDWLALLNSDYPIMHIVGSRLLETMQAMIPLMIKGGALGAIIVLCTAALRPDVLTRTRISALAMAIIPTISRSQGGYSMIFLIFFVFFEPWRGIGGSMALICAYLWCIPVDFTIWIISYFNSYSFISNRNVSAAMPITFGQLLRPAFLLFIEYGLVIASLGDLVRDVRRGSSNRANALSSGGGDIRAQISPPASGAA